MNFLRKIVEKVLRFHKFRLRGGVVNNFTRRQDVVTFFILAGSPLVCDERERMLLEAVYGICSKVSLNLREQF